MKEDRELLLHRAGRSSARAVGGARDGATSPRARRQVEEGDKPLEDARLVIQLGRLHAHLMREALILMRGGTS